MIKDYSIQIAQILAALTGREFDQFDDVDYSDTVDQIKNASDFDFSHDLSDDEAELRDWVNAPMMTYLVSVAPYKTRSWVFEDAELNDEEYDEVAEKMAKLFRNVGDKNCLTLIEHKMQILITPNMDWVTV